jgi:mannose-1-phosphate guanylyltransferase
MKNNYAVIMAGGVGSRFWPVSRNSYPKQFIDILGTGKSLLQLTYQRFLKIFPAENIFIVTNIAYVDLVKEQIKGIDPKQILAEPIARNTAPCIAYASQKIARLNPKANCIVAPSDHLITDEKAFLDTLQTGLQFTAKNDALLTLGIMPHKPDTGYGYIQYLKGKDGGEKIGKVKTFTEKPSLEIAKKFLESGDFLWNAGIFVWRNSVLRQAMETHMPDIYKVFQKASKFFDTDKEAENILDAYSKCPNISIDYGLMEKADNVYVLPSDFGWSDLGTWGALYELRDKDEHGNAAGDGKIFMYDSRNCLVKTSPGKLVVIKGINNAIIVETDDVLLVCSQTKEQEIKQIVTDIKLKFGDTYI